MAVLTWRNVDAPSDRGNSAITGLTAAARLFDTGASGLGDAIGRFGQQQTALANNAAAQAASRIQDSDQLKAALADGSLYAGLQGVDPSKVDARTVGDINSRVGDLLNYAGKDVSNQIQTQNLHTDQYKQNRLETENALIDAARPAANALALASKNRDAKGIAAASADPALAALPSAVFQKLMTDATAQEQGRASLTGTDLQNQGQGITNQDRAFDFGIKQRNDRAQQGALQVMDQLKDAASGTEAYQQYNQIANTLDPQVAASVRQALEQRWGPIFGGNGTGSPVGGSISSSGSTGSAGAAAGAPGSLSSLGGAPLTLGDPGTQNGGKYNVTFGFQKTDVPITSMSIGELTKDGGLMDQMIADPKLKNSPLGAYQINKATLQDYAKRLGLKPGTQFTPEVQDQIAEQLFNDRKSQDLTQTWAGLSKVPGAGAVGAFKNKSWAEMKDLITQAEGTAQAQSPQEVRNEGQTLINSLQGLVADRTQQSQLIGQNGFEKALANTSSGDAGSEASRLISSVPAFKGADAGWLTDEINMVAQKAHLTAPQAATLIQQHLKSNQGTLANAVDSIKTLGGLTDGFKGTDASPNLPSGQRIDDKALQAAIASNADGSAVKRYGQYLNLQSKNAQVAAAATAIQQAQEQLINARQRAAANPNWKGLAAYEQQYRQTVAQARLLLASAANNSSTELASGNGN